MKLFSFFSLLRKKIITSSVITEKNETERIQEIFQELREIQAKRQRLEQYIKRTNQRKQDLEQYESLTKEDHTKIAKLLDQYKSTMEQRKLMEGRLIRNNPALRVIQENEKEIQEILKEMRQAENNQRYAQNDMLYLEDEKNYLYDYREDLITAYKILKGVSIGFIVVLGIVCVVLLTMVQALEKNIFIATSIISVVSLFIGFWILIFKRRIEYELNKNEKMQQKAAKLLNRTKIKYFHYTNYLDYVYDKLGVKNADQLQGNYERYLKNRHNETHYQGMTRQLMEIEQRVFEVLYDKGVERDAFDHIDDWTQIQNSTTMIQSITAELQNTDKQIQALNVYEEELCKEVFLIAQANPELTSIVEALMETYISTRRNEDYLDKISEGE